MIDVALFDAAFDGKSFAAGDVVFRAGDPADSLYVVLSGEIAIRVDGVGDDVVGSGGVLGELALIDGGRRTGTAVARVDSVVVPMGRLRLEYFVAKHPSFALDLMTTIVGRVRRELDVLRN